MPIPYWKMLYLGKDKNIFNDYKDFGQLHRHIAPHPRIPLLDKPPLLTFTIERTSKSRYLCAGMRMPYWHMG